MHTPLGSSPKLRREKESRGFSYKESLRSCVHVRGEEVSNIHMNFRVSGHSGQAHPYLLKGLGLTRRKGSRVVEKDGQAIVKIFKPYLYKVH